MCVGAWRDLLVKLVLSELLEPVPVKLMESSFFIVLVRTLHLPAQETALLALSLSSRVVM